jgi:hypothetical protein
MTEQEYVAVAEAWQERYEQEKNTVTDEHSFRSADFTLLVSSLAMQAMIFLGRLESPIDGKAHTDIVQARFMIDTLGILEEKTTGALTERESSFLRESLYNLRKHYLAVVLGS